MPHPRLTIAVSLVLSGCGYVGSPLPPLMNVPSPVTGLAAVQREARIVVHFKLPTLTTEQMEITAPLKLDLRIGMATADPLRDGEWAARAQAVPEGPVEAGIATYEIPAGPWTGKDVTIAARVIGTNGKASGWTALEGLPVVPPPEKPATPKVQSTAEGLRLTWDGGSGNFRIYRRAGDEKTFARIADTPERDWTDHTTEFGKPYTYIVQRIVTLAGNREAESEPSEAGPAVTPEDTFAPGAPVGFRASPAAASVELSWDRNLEADLAGYRVYRALGGGEFEKVADVSQIPSYSDRGVERGKPYRYAVTAIDKSGNESQRSAIAEASLQ